VLIGNDNIFREMVQVHRSFKEGGETIIGNKNFFMGNAHIAHDCILHNNIIMANGATLAGHVEVMDNAFLSGFATVIQFRRVGQNAFLSVHSKINRDVPPYVIITGERGIISGLNIVGIRRAGFDKESIRQVKKLYRIYFRMGLSLNQAHHRAELDLDMSNPYVQKFIQFIKESKIGIALAEKEESPEGEEPAEEAE
jgi:UDP-N-acetylglucosamine acyltransferase